MLYGTYSLVPYYLRICLAVQRLAAWLDALTGHASHPRGYASVGPGLAPGFHAPRGMCVQLPLPIRLESLSVRFPLTSARVASLTLLILLPVYYYYY